MSAVAHIDEYKTGKFFTDEFRGNLSWNGYENNVLLKNRGMVEGEDGQAIPMFSDVAMALGVDDVRDARGVAVFDYDNDGDLDIAINHNPGDNGKDTEIPAVLYENQIGSRRSWLAITLEGIESNRDAVGAELRLKAGNLSLFRHIQAGSAYAAQQTSRVYFGLNNQQQVESLEILWPNGKRQIFKDIKANQFIHIVEGQNPVAVTSMPGAIQAGGK